METEQVQSPRANEDYSHDEQLAHMINSAIKQEIITSEYASNEMFWNQEISDKQEIIEIGKKMFRINFFMEYSEEHETFSKTDKTIADRGLVLQEELTKTDKDGNSMLSTLEKHNGGVSIAMITRDEETAKAFKMLNDRNIPITAWIVTDDEYGYWAHKGNVGRIIDETRDVLKWAKENDIKLERIGMDLEIPIQLSRAIFSINPKNIAKESIRYLKSFLFKENPNTVFSRELKKIQDEYPEIEIETYVAAKEIRRVVGWSMLKTPEYINKAFPMVYTSSVSNKFSKKLIRNSPIRELMALGILGKSRTSRPGRDLWGRKPKPNMSYKQLQEAIYTYLDSSILDIEKFMYLRGEGYVFALEDVSAVLQTQQALEDAFSQILKDSNIDL